MKALRYNSEGNLFILAVFLATALLCAYSAGYADEYGGKESLEEPAATPYGEGFSLPTGKDFSAVADDMLCVSQPQQITMLFSEPSFSAIPAAPFNSIGIATPQAIQSYDSTPIGLTGQPTTINAQSPSQLSTMNTIPSLSLSVSIDDFGSRESLTKISPVQFCSLAVNAPIVLEDERGKYWCAKANNDGILVATPAQTDIRKLYYTNFRPFSSDLLGATFYAPNGTPISQDEFKKVKSLIDPALTDQIDSWRIAKGIWLPRGTVYKAPDFSGLAGVVANIFGGQAYKADNALISSNNKEDSYSFPTIDPAAARRIEFFNVMNHVWEIKHDPQYREKGVTLEIEPELYRSLRRHSGPVVEFISSDGKPVEWMNRDAPIELFLPGYRFKSFGATVFAVPKGGTQKAK